ncbi:MAG: type II toxin-antitoxin system PemK/MazF family toxin [Candidatus Delongbacteria bacterium]|jgi:mRNA interferase MazF|nr:type II toxin-antitoxin system PemK/MazF family toxin [Candidatus Delongbacteria bacterium]MDY0017754.1 type II toxin-antitoxin system PemK/MazF family toxin [Candidatus Delongbacteria bacterium]
MKQGEIWLINLDPSIGSEIKKTRPAVIVSDDALGKLPLKIIVPVTEWKDRFDVAPWMVRIEADNESKLSKLSCADCFQVRSVSVDRFIKKIGDVSGSVQYEIRSGLSKVLSIE